MFSGVACGIDAYANIETTEEIMNTVILESILWVGLYLFIIIAICQVVYEGIKSIFT